MPRVVYGLPTYSALTAIFMVIGPLYPCAAAEPDRAGIEFF